jgi:hypothetical protein
VVELGLLLMTESDLIPFLLEIIYPDALNNVQREVLILSWRGLAYQQMQLNYNADYLKSVGYNLFRKLTQKLGRQVSKPEFKSAMEYEFSHRSKKAQSALNVEIPRHFECF